MKYQRSCIWSITQEFFTKSNSIQTCSRKILSQGTLTYESSRKYSSTWSTPTQCMQVLLGSIIWPTIHCRTCYILYIWKRISSVIHGNLLTDLLSVESIEKLGPWLLFFICFSLLSVSQDRANWILLERCSFKSSTSRNFRNITPMICQKWFIFPCWNFLSSPKFMFWFFWLVETVVSMGYIGAIFYTKLPGMLAS